MSENLGQKSPKKRKPSFVYAILSITLILFVVGLVGLGYYYSEKGLKSIKESIEMEVILHADLEKKQIDETSYFLKNLEGIKDSKFISKEDALKDFSKELGQNIGEIAGENPLYDAFVIHLKSNNSNKDSIQKIVEKLKKHETILEVDYSKDILDMVSISLQRAPIIIGIFCILLLFIAFFLIDNTIRLMMFSQRFLIRSMQLIGATKGFIMKPFLIRAIISGIISAILAISIWSILLYLGYFKFSFNYTSNDLVIFGIGASCLVVFGILVSILSTYLSVNKYLRLKLDELY